jgi:ATP-dependent Lon protease
VIVDGITGSEGEMVARYSDAPAMEAMDASSSQAILKYAIEAVREVGSNFQGSEHFLKPLDKMTTVEEVIGFVMPFMPVPLGEKQALLETYSEKEQGLAFLDMLNKRKEEIELQIELARKSNEKLNKSHREALLRQQLQAIQEELEEESPSQGGKKDYRALIEASEMPEEVKKVALEQVNKLDAYGPQNPEAGITRSYLDLLVELPWAPGKEIEVDLDEARAVLDAGHHGLDEVKDRIIQHLAVMVLKKEKKGSILLLVGPPGTGKTSLGKSIAEALDRKYVRLSLGGIKDEAEIRGHRRTYIGALPGRIIQGMKKAGEKNPVFVLDEVDKLMAAFNGNPASALLEVLDPEQNDTFSDHYLEVPYDLSEVFFVATANTAQTIPAPLLDRMEVIQITSYTNTEKLAIGTDHLLPEVLEDHGLDETQLEIRDETMRAIIENYTREAGVRGLKKQLAKIARVASAKIVSNQTELPFRVEPDMLHDILGKKVARLEDALADNVPGVVTGLAWTPVGGDILFMEAMYMPGRGKLILTGQLGAVMKESAQISLSLVRSRLAHLTTDFDFNKNDIHVHVPSGATPKDGPSAGVALLTAVASLLLGRKVDPKLAMTGEITLRGSVLPVGGIKEKILAAHRAGIEKVVLAKENEEDLKDVPEEVREELAFVLVETVEDVLKEALDLELPTPEGLFAQRAEPSLVPEPAL